MIRQFSLALVSLALLASTPGRLAAADAPEDLLVGYWENREQPHDIQHSDAKMIFAKGGGGELSEMEEGKRLVVPIRWKVTHTFGNACVVVIDYDIPEPKPKEAQPMTWLVAMDGRDSFVVQAMPNRIDFWDRSSVAGNAETK